MKPRVVYLGAMIADQLKRDGFKYLKSGLTLKRRQGDITQEIHFGSPVGMWRWR